MISAGRGCIPNRKDIDDRPNVVDNCNRIGDWEGDTVIGSNKGGAVLAAVVEHKTSYAIAAKSQDKTTTSVISAINHAKSTLASLVKTLRFDKVKEFSNHELISSTLGCDIYFDKH